MSNLLSYSFNTKLLFYLVKTTNIFYVGVLYMILGGTLSFCVNKFYPKRDDKKLNSMNIIQMGLEVLFMSAFLFVMVYIIRSIVKRIGSPLNNIAGFEFHRLKELNGGVVLSLALILFSHKLINMAKIFSERVSEINIKHIFSESNKKQIKKKIFLNNN